MAYNDYPVYGRPQLALPNVSTCSGLAGYPNTPRPSGGTVHPGQTLPAGYTTVAGEDEVLGIVGAQWFSLWISR